MFKSAILKLTFSYVLLSMLLSLLFSGVLYHFATQELQEGLENQYHMMARNDFDADNVNIQPINELNTRSSNLISDLIYFNVVVFFGSTVASYILARRTLRPIEDTHQAQIRFTAEASHELRTPLAAMRADTESVLMQKKQDPRLMKAPLKENLQDILKLQKLADHLLQMSRYKNQSTLVRESIDLQKMMKEIAHQAKRHYPDRKINTELKGKSVHIVADPIAIQQLVMIILDNAIKYSKQGSFIHGEIAEDTNSISIIISDEGVGINSEDLPHIFEHFYRSTNAQNNENQASGYGLGLPLAKDIVDLYHGQISIKSVEDEGTTVTVSLPRRFLK